MPTPLTSYIADVLARPDVRKARRAELRHRAAAAPVESRPLTHFAVKGDWRAEEVEPCLASPRSSLNPAFILRDEDL